MKSKTMAGMGEFGWLKTLLPRLYWPTARYSQLWIKPGDDAGVLGITPGCGLIATTDGFVEGVHFERRWGVWEELGEKILTVNLSDLAAMGDVKPLAALVTAAFPGDMPVDTVDKLYTGMKRCAQRWKTGFLGGDTVGSRGAIFISVTLLGEGRKADLIRRDTARVGDWLVTSGPCGLAGAGLEVVQHLQTRLSWTQPLTRAFLTPQPRFPEATWLAKRRLATSMMDISDGLAASARILAEASGTGVRLDGDALPLTPALQRWAKRQRKKPSTYALYGGEDYELMFTIHPRAWPAVHRAWARARVVGEMRPKREGFYTVEGRKKFPLEGYGFSHFSRD